MHNKIPCFRDFCDSTLPNVVHVFVFVIDFCTLKWPKSLSFRGHLNQSARAPEETSLLGETGTAIESIEGSELSAAHLSADSSLQCTERPKVAEIDGPKCNPAGWTPDMAGLLFRLRIFNSVFFDVPKTADEVTLCHPLRSSPGHLGMTIPPWIACFYPIFDHGTHDIN